MKWLSGLVTESEVVTIKDKKSHIYKTTKILIVSYDTAKNPEIAQKIINHEHKFNVSIADEAHLLKS